MSQQTFTTTDDVLLARSDSALPALTVLLDDQALTAFVQSHDPSITSAHATYLRYKPGTAVLAAVHLYCDDGEKVALAHGVTEQGTAKLDKLSRSAAKRRTWCFSDTTFGLALAGAGADRRLPGLSHELDTAGAATIRYKPARRWVGHRRTSGTPALIKVYSGGQAQHSARAAAFLRHSGFPGPTLLRSSPSKDTLAFRWVEGQTLDDLHGSDLAAVGHLLAQLHTLRMPRPASAPRTYTCDLGINGTGIEALAAANPALHGAACTAADLSLKLQSLPTATAAPVTSHGDFSADQVLRDTGGNLRLLDSDSLGWAPRESDLGTWIGEALTRACTPGLSPSAIAQGVLTDSAGMVDAYEQECGVSVDRNAMLAVAATTVINRAAEPFRHRDPRWVSAATARIALAVHLTAKAGAL